MRVFLFFLSSLLPSALCFCCSSTFKDAERASLRDSGHGDSDQADSDQDTNKGSHCDTSAREALKMKATAVNGQPFEQGEWTHSLPDMLKMTPGAAIVFIYATRPCWYFKRPVNRDHCSTLQYVHSNKWYNIRLLICSYEMVNKL